jgi:hypothetical protein
MTQSDDHGLSTLLHEAVSDVEPTDRLTAIRAGVRRHRTRRLWLVSGGGAAIAAAATVAAVALATPPKTIAEPAPGPATGPPTSVSPPTTDITTGPAEPTGSAIALYYLGGSKGDPKLYREFHVLTAAAIPADALDGIATAPDDPDYRTFWSGDDLAFVKEDADLITVGVNDALLRDRPAGMSEGEAEASIQQVVYTMQAMAQKRLPVQFTLNDNPIDQVFGVPTSEPLTNAPILETLSRVNLTTPEEGQEVTDTLEVDGVSNSFEANVPWSIEDSSGAQVASGAITAEGYMDTKLFPFRDSIDVSSLDPGTYTFIVSTDDPSGAGQVDQDSRRVIIR